MKHDLTRQASTGNELNGNFYLFNPVICKIAKNSNGKFFK